MVASQPLIQREFYGAIVACLPILCVDVIVRHEGKILLIRRVKEPLRGYMWVPGGRILKNETGVNAARRKVKEETGLQIRNIRFVGYYEDFYEASAWDVPTHTTSLVYEADTDSSEVVLNEDSNDFRWGDEVPHRLTERLIGPSRQA